MGEMLSQAEVEALLNGSPLPDSEDEAANTTVSSEDSANSVIKDVTTKTPTDAKPKAKAKAKTKTKAGNTLDDGITDTEIAVDTVTNEDKKIDSVQDGNGEGDMFSLGEDPAVLFTPTEIDALGEIGNISMGNSATTLFALLNKKVNITTPKVTVSSLREIAAHYSAPLVVVKVEYTEGLTGSNLLVLKEADVMLITDLMMGGDGKNIQGEITDLHLSAISEAMNQMIGNSSTSLSNVFEMKIDISPPHAVSIKINEEKNGYYITLESIEWSDYRGMIEYDDDGDEIDKELRLPIGIDGILYEDEIVIQNSGNSMNYYVKLGECDLKYIHLIKE